MKRLLKNTCDTWKKVKKINKEKKKSISFKDLKINMIIRLIFVFY